LLFGFTRFYRQEVNVGNTKTNFTVRALEKLESQEKRYSVFDSDTRGLGIAVYPSGQKTFFHLRKVQGWPRRTTLGSFPDLSVEIARGKASELNGKLAKWQADDFEGPSPLKPRAKIPTLGEVLLDYTEKHLKPNSKNGESAVKYANWQFDCYLAPWRNRPVSTITRADIKTKHSEIGAKHGHVTANRTVTFLRRLFGHALHPDIALWNGANPARDPKKFLFDEKSRERTIQRGEAPTFFKELARESNVNLRDFALLALSTGARRGTILAMQWSQIDWEHALWTIPNPKSKKKSRKPHVVPLTKLAISVLKSRPHVKDNDWVFPGRKGHMVTLRKPWKLFLKRAKISDLTFHDLRRTLATHEGDTGAPTELIQKTLGHSEASAATKIYDRSDRRDDVRDAMSIAVEALLVAGKTTKRKLLLGAPTAP
jgi:integrase